MVDHGGQSPGSQFPYASITSGPAAAALSPVIQPERDSASRFSWLRLSGHTDTTRFSWLFWEWSSTRDTGDDFLESIRSLETPITALELKTLDKSGTNLSLGSQGTDTSEPPKETGLGKCDLKTRYFCIVGLVIGSLIAIASICGGAMMLASPAAPLPSIFVDRMVTAGYISTCWARTRYQVYWYPGRRVWMMPQALTIILPLVLNALATLVLDSTSFIHETSLRWTLCHEDRLRFNSNPRLVTNSRTHILHRWYFNLLSAGALSVCYGSISVLTMNLYIIGTVDRAVDDGNSLVSTEVNGPRYGLDIDGYGILGLGIGLLILVIISTGCLLSRPDRIKSWCSNPLTTTKAARDNGLLDSFRQTSSRDAGAPKSTLIPEIPTEPLDRQPSMLKTVPHIRRTLYVVWALFLASLIWTIVVAVVAAVQWKATSRSYVITYGYLADLAAYWQFYGAIYLNFADDTDTRSWLGLIIQCVVQAIPTFGLHCVELLVNLANDEATWQEASLRRGARVSSDADCFSDTLREWLRVPTVTLFIFKSVIQWVFGTALAAGFLIVAFSLLPIVVLTFLLLLLALFAQYLAKRRPLGSQPATYGKVRSLNRLIDHWDERIWFGDKGGTEQPRVRVAGTASRTLPGLKRDKLYLGLKGDDV